MKDAPVWLLGLLSLACSDGVDDGEAAGELGNGKFRYECLNASDPICPRPGGTASTFPERIGVEGRFEVSFDEFDAPMLTRVRVEPASHDIIHLESGVLRARELGTVALLARRTSDGRIIDFLHVEVVDVVHIDVQADGASPSPVWRTGEPEVLTAKALERDRGILAGAREFTWSTSDPNVVRLRRANPTAQMEMFPLKAGEVIIGVDSGPVSARLQVTVEGAPVSLPDGGTGPPDDAGTPDGDASDAGAPPNDAMTASDAALDAPRDAGLDGAPTDDAFPDGGSSDGGASAEGGVP